MNLKRIFVGYDSREDDAWLVCARSIIARASIPVSIEPVNSILQRRTSLYTRPETFGNGRTYDEISGAPLSTEFAIARFMVPHIARSSGWVLFCDSDFLFRADIAELFALADDRYAVMCVKHDYAPSAVTKMDNQVQTVYPRKNWSSLMLINTDHEAVRALTPPVVNTMTGAVLHRFSWLQDDEIGGLPVAWNWLSGHSENWIEPKAVHFTSGIPSMPGYENSAFADEWFEYAR